MRVLKVIGHKIKLIDEDRIFWVQPIWSKFTFDAHGKFIKPVFAFSWKILTWEVPFFIHNWFSVK